MSITTIIKASGVVMKQAPKGFWIIIALALLILSGGMAASLWKNGQAIIKISKKVEKLERHQVETLPSFKIIEGIRYKSIEAPTLKCSRGSEPELQTEEEFVGPKQPSDIE